MATTIIDPEDGRSYDLAREDDKWTIRETATGRRPPELQARGSFKTQEQALSALREICSHKEQLRT